MGSKEKKKILNYLESRRSGRNDWISFNVKDTESKFENIFCENIKEIKKHKKVYGLFTNVIWDAQLHFKSSAFESMIDWLNATIEHFICHPEKQLIIRIHPAEVSGTVVSRQPVIKEIFKNYKTLPENITIIPPDEKISSYKLADLIDVGLVYGTKMALELACTGMPVVVAGDSWVRGKGFTYDVTDEEGYLKILENGCKLPRLTSLQQDRALQFAYHLFFQRMIQIECLMPLNKFAPFKVSCDNIEAIRNDGGLNLICDGIINGTPFTSIP